MYRLISPTATSTESSPERGALDLPEIISALEKSGYEGYFAIELFNADLWALPAKETARRCYESLLPLCEG